MNTRETLIRCVHCGEHKPADAFPGAKRKASGLSSWCRACHAQRNREYRAHKRQLREAEHEAQKLEAIEAKRRDHDGKIAKLRESEAQHRRIAERRQSRDWSAQRHYALTVAVEATERGL